ncbi:hypothetical protein EDD40_7318 [Saccharothrix texasensis]|uniref:Uncharacterized protein n=1 Tax=Saccharothrix texasensis TaxID=103734 RepID=A0A3N1HHB0_9PSEU|nr:hypothetical protein EDD40_7318 [Saccharothrix texasensis]
MLRHENAVLRRQLAGPVRYEPADRFRFAALSGLMDRRRWRAVFPVMPGTVLAWHRKLIARPQNLRRPLQPTPTPPSPQPTTTRSPAASRRSTRPRHPQTAPHPHPWRPHQRVQTRSLTSSDDFSSGTGSAAAATNSSTALSSGTNRTYSTPCTSTRSSTTPTDPTKASTTHDHYTPYHHPSPTKQRSPISTSANDSGWAESSTSTTTLPDLHGRRFRQAQGSGSFSQQKSFRACAARKVIVAPARGLFQDRCVRPDTPGLGSGGMGTVSDDI